ncbi:hypothetical protein AB834_00485 [PVC group bacterium (ex Bugula neritina AB1)]|nr:hypothetical protein AB834_00485 [PVC group bacterium (ex Bugula neritina AB1)]
MSLSTMGSREIIGLTYHALSEQKVNVAVSQLTMPFLSNQEIETYKWISSSPMLREWVGGRNAKSFTSQGIDLKSKLFESTLAIDIDDLRREKSGQLELRITQHASSSFRHWNKLVSQLIQQGETKICYDGSYFFDTDHQEGDSGLQSNSISVDISSLPISGSPGSTTSPATEQAEGAILKGIEQIMGFKNDVGEPINDDTDGSFLVVCPLNLYRSCVTATTSPVVDSGKTNPIVTSGLNIQVFPDKRLSWTDKFAIFKTDSVVKPFLRQFEISEMPQISYIGAGSEEEFKNRRHLLGLSSIRNVGYALWQNACLVTLS